MATLTEAELIVLIRHAQVDVDNLTIQQRELASRRANAWLPKTKVGGSILRRGRHRVARMTRKMMITMGIKSALAGTNESLSTATVLRDAYQAQKDLLYP